MFNHIDNVIALNAEIAQVAKEHGYTLDSSLTYGEEADACQGFNSELADVLRAAEARWFEIEG